MTAEQCDVCGEYRTKNVRKIGPPRPSAAPPVELAAGVSNAAVLRCLSERPVIGVGATGAGGTAAAVAVVDVDMPRRGAITSVAPAYESCSELSP